MKRRSILVAVSAVSAAVGISLILYGALYAYPKHRDVSAAKDLVSGMMKDPSSAIFQDVQRNLPKTKGAFPVSVCGQINAKNGFGALAGFQRFIVDVKSAAVNMDPENTENEDQADAKERECRVNEIDDNSYAGEYCERAVKEIRDKEIQQIDFEISWQANCAIPSKEGY